MPTIIATRDGFVPNVDAANWSNCRNDTAGVAAINFLPELPNAVSVNAASPSTYTILRSFFLFDTSGISVVPSAATLNIYGFGFTTANIMVVKSTQSVPLAVGDFDAITGWAGAGDQSGNVTRYSAAITSWNGSAYNVITLTATALSDIASLNDFKVCLIEDDHDLQDSAISPVVTYASGFTYSDHRKFKPFLDYTAGAAAVDDAIFFGHNF